MNVSSNYKRDPELASKVTKHLPDGSLVAVEDCEVFIPAKYLSKGLAYIEANVSSLGIFALVSGGKYTTMMVQAMVTLLPVSNRREIINGEECVAFEFPAGATIIKTDDVVKDKILSYYIYDYFITRAYIPWFIKYDDLLRMYYNDPHYTGTQLGSDHSIMPVIVSMIARDPNDKTVLWRNVKSKYPPGTEPAWVPFKSVIYGPRTTTAKLMGSYFDIALPAALINHNDVPERIEQIYRI